MMSASERQVISDLVRDPVRRMIVEKWIGEKIEASNAALRESVRQGKWKDAAMSEGGLRAYEDLLSELTRL